jgi:hypothetical protein
LRDAVGLAGRWHRSWLLWPHKCCED